MAIKIWRDNAGIWAQVRDVGHNRHGAAWLITQAQLDDATESRNFLHCEPLVGEFGFLVHFEDRFQENDFWEILFRKEKDDA